MGVIASLSAFDPRSSGAGFIRDLFLLVIAVTSLIFILVEGVLIAALWRNRRSQGPDDSQPPQVYGSRPIETAWTAAPFLIVFVLILLVARSLWDVVRPDPSKSPPGSEPLVLTVIGHQWWWEYHYETSAGAPLNFTAANELHLPASEPHAARPVFLRLQSADVDHSFWIPKLGGKTDLIPVRINTLWIETEERGLFLGQCAEYCGYSHARMLLRVYVDEPEAFQRWVKGQQQAAADEPQGRAGRDLFLSLSCMNCHAVRGTKAAGAVGPDLTHLMSRETLGSGILPNNAENIRRWVRDSQKLKPGCLMPAFTLSDQELDQLVAYLATLR